MPSPISRPASWIDGFAALGGLDDDIRTYLLTGSNVINAPAQKQLFGPGKPAENFLLLLEGIVRVQKTSANGREIVLYRVAAGESCVMTTACLFSQDDYGAEGIAETDIEAVLIPRAIFDKLVARSSVFRKFVFDAYGERLSELLAIINEIAFSKIDIRLAQRLLRLADSAGQVAATHQALAQELGTAREVITRQLQEFQRRGWIALNRGKIQIDKHSALESLSAEA